MAKKYNICGKSVEGIRSAERQLTALYQDMCNDLGIDHGKDSAAWRECFHNWKDSLNRDGLLCDAACYDLCPVGDKFR